MSRRTKLLITALFLVLSCIAIAGAVYYRPPKNPLRFALAASQEPGPPVHPMLTDAPPPYWVTVENTGHTPVMFFGAWLDDISVPNSRGYFMAQVIPGQPLGSDPPIDSSHWRIPPHSSIRCGVMAIEDDALGISRRGHTEVIYMYDTPLRHRYAQILRWIHHRAPERLLGWLKAPDYLRDTTFLQVPPAQRSD